MRLKPLDMLKTELAGLVQEQDRLLEELNEIQDLIGEYARLIKKTSEGEEK